MALAIGLSAGDVFAQDVLPKLEPAFNGTIGRTYKDSKPDFPKPLQAAADAPNVLLVPLDDVGFGHAGTFGGAVATLPLTGSRRTGCATIVFTRPPSVRPHAPHCLPGVIIELGTGFPGDTGFVPNTTSGFPEILRQNGYTTDAFGKWHTTPDNAGPPTEVTIETK